MGLRCEVCFALSFSLFTPTHTLPTTVWQVAIPHAPIVSSDSTISECSKKMKHTLSRSLFVVDSQGSILGIVDANDLFNYVYASSTTHISQSLSSVDLHMERLHEETKGFRHVVLSLVDHLITSFIILLLMIADLTLAVYAMARDVDIHDDDEKGNLLWMHIITLVILGIFVIEIMLRIYAYREEFLNLIDMFDAFVVTTAFAFSWFETGEFTGLVVILRLLRLMRAVRVCSTFCVFFLSLSHSLTHSHAHRLLYCAKNDTKSGI